VPLIDFFKEESLSKVAKKAKRVILENNLK